LNIELLFVIENSIKLQKMVLEGKTIILWVNNVMYFDETILMKHEKQVLSRMKLAKPHSP
jgi:hypothetical protein